MAWDLPIDQVAQSPIQPGLEHCQGGDSHNFSEQPGQVPYHPQSKEFLPLSNLNLPTFSLKPLPLVLSLHAPVKKSFSSFLVGPLQVQKCCKKVFVEPSLSQAEQPQLSQPFLTAEVFLTGLHLDIEPLTSTLWAWPCSQFLIHWVVHPPNPCLSNLETRMS